jgi:uncharacterized protein YqgV (UPF0045/DUF77 family)
MTFSQKETNWHERGLEAGKNAIDHIANQEVDAMVAFFHEKFEKMIVGNLPDRQKFAYMIGFAEGMSQSPKTQANIEIALKSEADSLKKMFDTLPETSSAAASIVTQNPSSIPTPTMETSSPDYSAQPTPTKPLDTARAQALFDGMKNDVVEKIKRPIKGLDQNGLKKYVRLLSASVISLEEAASYANKNGVLYIKNELDQLNTELEEKIDEVKDVIKEMKKAPQRELQNLVGELKNEVADLKVKGEESLQKIKADAESAKAESVQKIEEYRKAAAADLEQVKNDYRDALAKTLAAEREKLQPKKPTEAPKVSRPSVWMAKAKSIDPAQHVKKMQSQHSEGTAYGDLHRKLLRMRGIDESTFAAKPVTAAAPKAPTTPDVKKVDAKNADGSAKKANNAAAA